MRHTDDSSGQLSFTVPWIQHEHAQALALISEILDARPELATLVARDLLRGVAQPQRGAPGLMGDQVLRIAVVKHVTGDAYRALAFRLADSLSYRAFCRIGAFEPVPSYQTLQQNVRKIRAATWAKIHRVIVQLGLDAGLDAGARVRIDSTVVEADIHAPTDATLLVDGVRRLLRGVHHAARYGVGRLASGAHKRLVKQAQRRALAIQHTAAKDVATRERLYQELVAITRDVVQMAAPVCQRLQNLQQQQGLQLGAFATTAGRSVPVRARVVTELATLLTNVARVIDQTERRVVQHESVPATEKIVSLAEPHTDILVKDRRATYYGHKIVLSAGQRLVLDVAIVRGNPNDATWTVPMLQRLQAQYGLTPPALTYDGAFASQDNLTTLKGLGVPHVVFAKGRGLERAAMTDDPAVFRLLRRFRAGVESMISRLKRAFGLTRATWRRDTGFVAYVRSAVVAANLMMLAQHMVQLRH